VKLCIIGAGAMGSLLGFVLSAQAEVWLLSRRPDHVYAINTRGLRCEENGVEAVRYPHATSDFSVVGACDVVLVLVKAHQTGWAAEQLRQGDRGTGRQRDTDGVSLSPALPLSLSAPLVVTLQNGIGNREILAEALGAERVGQAVTSLGATLLGPGRVRWAGHGETMFGAQPDPAMAQALADLFCAAGLPASVTDDLDALVWGKLLINVGINALTALLRVPNGALVDVPEARQLLEQAVTEAAQVAAAHGIHLPYDDPVAHVLAVARATTQNRSSMLQDVLRGSPTEIAMINGAVIREGQRLGVPTPVNALLTMLIEALDASADRRV
jgi:2-dehydropantoate 2-reductase